MVVTEAISGAMPIARFGGYEVDLLAGELRKGGHRIHLREQSFQVLAVLLEHPGEIVSREDLRRRLWNGEVFVDFENNLNAIVARLRQALCDTAEKPRFIETLPKRGYRFIGEVQAGTPAAKRPRLLVLPLLNLSGDPAQEYFSDAMTDEMISALANVAPDRIAVLARTTAMRYKATSKDVARIGRELQLDFVVEGAVRRSGDEISLSVQLIRAGDEVHLFAGRYTETIQSIVDSFAGIAHDIVANVPGSPKRDSAPERLRSRQHTGDPLAYDHYIQGRHAFDRGDPEAFRAAHAHFTQAIQRDPMYADAYDALAELYWYMAYFGYMPPRHAFTAGMVYAVRALEIDNHRAETHALLGQFHKISEYNWAEVEREMSLAIHLDPNSAVVRARYALSGLMPHGRLKEAISQLERALELDPLYLLARNWLGVMLLLARRYEDGMAASEKLLDIEPNSWPAYFTLALCHHYRGEREEAAGAMRRAVAASGGACAPLSWLGLMLGAYGQSEEARSILRELESRASSAYVPASCLAWGHLGLREVDAGFACMERAVEECDQFMMPIKSYGFLEPLRGHPRYLALLRKMNLEA